MFVGRLYGADTFPLAITLFVVWAVSDVLSGRVEEVVILIGVMFIAYPLFSAAMQLKSPLPPVSSTVGFASYTGCDKSHHYYASSVLLVLSIVLPLAPRLAF